MAKATNEQLEKALPEVVESEAAQPKRKEAQTPRVQLVDFETVKARAGSLVDTYAARNTEYDKYERMYLIDPAGSDEGKTSAAGARLLFDPHGANVINRIVQMYAVNPLAVSVLADETESARNEQAAQNVRERRASAENCEKFLKAVLYASQLVSVRDCVADSLFAAALYGSVTHIIAKSADIPADAESRVVDEAAPFVVGVPHPKQSYPKLRQWRGVSYHVIAETATLGEIREDYGAAANFLTGNDDDEVTVYDYMSPIQHTVWVDEQSDKPLLHAANQHGIMPRTFRRGSSPGFLREPEQESLPFLYAYLKSGLFAARNIALTAGYTDLVDYLTPQLLHYKQPGSPTVAIDFSKRGGITSVVAGDKIEPTPMRLHPPEYYNFLGVLTQAVEESTMARVSGGMGVTAAAGLHILAAVSKVATYQIARTVELAFAETLGKILQWVKADPLTVYRIWGIDSAVILRPSDVVSVQARVKLTPDQALEKQMIAVLAMQLFRTGLGYDDYFEMLESGGIVESASTAFENFLERTMIDAAIPQVAKEYGQVGRALMGVAQQVPEVPPLQPQMPSPFPPSVSAAMLGGEPAVGGMPAPVPMPPPESEFGGA